MTVRERCELANEYQKKTMNCCQRVLLAFTDVTGLTEEQSMAIAGGMGHGLCFGSVCGSVNGAVMVLGMAHPHTVAGGMDAKRRSKAITVEFERRVKERIGALECRDLLEKDEGNTGGLSAAPAQGNRCMMITYTIIELLCEYLEELKEE